MLPPLTLLQVVRSIHHEDTPRSSTKKNSVQDKSSPNPNNDRKMIVNINNLENAVSSEINDEGKPMHVYGLELDPKPDSSLKTSTTTDDYNSGNTDKLNAETFDFENPVNQKQKASPAMKLIHALTPSRKKIIGNNFTFENE